MGADLAPHLNILLHRNGIKNCGGNVLWSESRHDWDELVVGIFLDDVRLDEARWNRLNKNISLILRKDSSTANTHSDFDSFVEE